MSTANVDIPALIGFWTLWLSAAALGGFAVCIAFIKGLEFVVTGQIGRIWLWRCFGCLLGCAAIAHLARVVAAGGMS